MTGKRITISSTSSLLGQMNDALTETGRVRASCERTAAASGDDSPAALAAETLQEVTRGLECLIKTLEPDVPGIPGDCGQGRTYHGSRAGGHAVVTVSEYGRNGELTESPLDPRLDLWNHSPTGMEWGYPGSGPAQLALAILADATGDGSYAKLRHQRFKQDVTAEIRQNSWTIHPEDVAGWVNDHPPDPARMEWAEWEEREKTGAANTSASKETGPRGQ